MSKQDKQVFYRHIRHGQQQTIAMKLVDGVYQYGIAKCSNKDQYCKATGRKLAESRISSNNIINISDINKVLLDNSFGNKLYTPNGIAKSISIMTTEDFTINFIFSIILQKEQ